MTDRDRSGSGPRDPRGRSTFVVLAGGNSRRMGREKAFLRVGGREMLDRVLEAGRPSCSEAVLAVGEPGPYTDALRRYGWEPAAGPSEPDPGSPRFRRGGVELRLVADRRPGLGPVAGLEAGLAAAGGPLCFAAACDLPFLRTTVVAALLRRLDALRDGTEGREALAVVPRAGGRRHPLAAAYTVGCADAARRCLEAGELSMADFLGRLDRVREVEAAELAPGEVGGDGAGGDPERALVNVNRPDELRDARRRLAREEAPAGETIHDRETAPGRGTAPGGEDAPGREGET